MKVSFLCFIILLTILPVKALNTTEKALQELYWGHHAEGIDMLLKAANTNDLIAQFYMGQCFEYGIGVDIDVNNAFGYYRKAAERGLPQAMMEIARCYRFGIGVNKNETRASEWEKRSSSRDTGLKLPDIRNIYKESLSNMNNSPSKIEESIAEPNKDFANVDERTYDNTRTSIDQKHDNPNVVIEAKESKSDKHKILSDVDIDIPKANIINDNYFALIIANENYQDLSSVPNAINDGDIFTQYCISTLGLPSDNVHFVKNATLNNIKREIKFLTQISDVYEGNASFIIYYAGHGFPDEKTRDAYLIPVDGYVSDLSTCYRLSDLYDILGSLKSEKNIIFLDACFSGASRSDDMLVAARGIAIKPNPSSPSGNTIVITSSQGDETSYAFDEQHHGLFTYYLLKKIKEAKGEMPLGDLVDYLKAAVTKKSLVMNQKIQTPSAIVSKNIIDNWKDIKLN